MYAYVDGILPLRDARVPLTDRGYLLGDGVFETMRTHRGSVWQEARHRARLERGAAHFGLDAGDWDKVVGALCTAMGDGGRIRVQLTGGDMDGFLGGSGSRMTGTVVPLVPHGPGGIDVVTTTVPLPVSPWSGCKTLYMQPYLAARREAEAKGAHDGLLCNGDQIVEASTSNVFAFVDGHWHSPGPKQGAVDGVTRQVLLDHVEAKESLSRAQAARVSHMVLTNTTGPRAVQSLDGRPLEITGPASELVQLHQQLLDAA